MWDGLFVNELDDLLDIVFVDSKCRVVLVLLQAFVACWAEVEDPIVFTPVELRPPQQLRYQVRLPRAWWSQDHHHEASGQNPFGLLREAYTFLGAFLRWLNT